MHHDPIQRLPKNQLWFRDEPIDCAFVVNAHASALTWLDRLALRHGTRAGQIHWLRRGGIEHVRLADAWRYAAGRSWSRQGKAATAQPRIIKFQPDPHQRRRVS
jgi:hypothetical protein